ncbi:MAG: hypothetical protein ACREXR_10945 [Gammaproteobacteria bacterium]
MLSSLDHLPQIGDGQIVSTEIDAGIRHRLFFGDALRSGYAEAAQATMFKRRRTAQAFIT